MAGKTEAAILRNAVVSGVIASAATTAAAAAFGARDTGSGMAAVNSTSHILWGSAAARARRADLKHTAPALLLNTGATIFWGAIYEALFGRTRTRERRTRALLGAGAVATLAYVTDYHLVPKRLTPGWEERVSKRSLAAIYVVLALSLSMRGLAVRGRSARA